MEIKINITMIIKEMDLIMIKKTMMINKFLAVVEEDPQMEVVEAILLKI
jgi:hypothetical protein